jgi:hypothetical protein
VAEGRMRAMFKAMSTILSPDKQEERLQDFIHETMDNFSMARCLTDLIIKHRKANIPLPRATLHIESVLPSASAHVSAETCGFLVVPVIRMALLDCNRSLTFFGLACDRNSKTLKPIKLPRSYSDDLGIEQFGLPLVSPAQFNQAASAVVPAGIEPILMRVYEWRNKMVAHFTTSEPVIEYPEIRDISIIMIEAYMRFVFDALGRPRPSINPSPS